MTGTDDEAAALATEIARAHRAGERRRHWLQAAAELTDALQPPISTDRALEEITRRARVAADAFATAIVQFPVGLDPVVAAHDGPAGDGVSGFVSRVIRDARVAERHAVALEIDLGERHAIALPLRPHLAEPGILLVIRDRPLPVVGAEELELLAAYADQAGLAVDRAEAVADREQLAVVSERARIARDLHDVVIQRLFAAGLRLEGFRSAADLSAEADSLVHEVVDELDLTIRDIRSTIFSLKQPPRGSLVLAVRALADEYTDVLGSAPSVRTQGPVDLLVPGHVAQHLEAVLRESLSNSARHARAHDVAVEVAVVAEEVVLRVSDDGVGMPARPHGSGLANARDRAALLRGSLEISPAPDGGTVVTWRAPLAPGHA